MSGTLTSFNYPTAALELIRYTSCVRREAGYCGIQWSQTQYTSGDGSIATVTPDPFALDTILTTGLAVSFFKTFHIEYYVSSLNHWSPADSSWMFLLLMLISLSLALETRHTVVLI